MSAHLPRHAKAAQRHLIILAHPDADSFNAAAAAAYSDAVRSLGHVAVVRDLYRLNFNPVRGVGETAGTAHPLRSPDDAAEFECLRDIDVLVLVYPIWFGTPPAMMKGYIERVLGADFGYRDVQAHNRHPLLGGKHLISITTSGSTITWLDLHGAWRSLQNVFDRYLTQVFGMASNEHLHLESVVPGMDQASGSAKLKKVELLAHETCAQIAQEKDRAGSPQAAQV